MKNLTNMLKQAQQMQARMQEMQAKLEATEVEGAAGGGMVKVTLNGKGDLRRVAIDPSLMTADDREVLEDLLVAAHADAKQKVEATMAEEMQKATAGLNLPGGLPCVVEGVAELWALERAHAHRGLYHVLGGTLSALGGVGPDDLAVQPLLARIAEGGVEEVILALPATVDGATTAHYLTDRLKPSGVTVTR